MNIFVRKIIKKLAYSGCLKCMPDKMYLKLLFPAHVNYKLNLKCPKTYNEKLQWLKLYDRNPVYTKLVDKLEVKQIIGKQIGNEYIIPTLGVWERYEDIDFSVLPNSFVLKCTHDSGGLVVCKDKNILDLKKTQEKINKSLNTNYYYSCREWPYKNVTPKIIAEEYIGDRVSVPEDYKFYTFDGEIDSVMVCKGREYGHPEFIFYDVNWNRLYYNKKEVTLEKEEEKPENFDKMVEIVRVLSKGYSQLRVDLYNVKGKIYFGELTFFNQSGFDADITYETDIYWGEKIKLSLY